MEAMRCKECGDVRWSLRGFGDREPLRCEICGATMVPERRLPNHGPLTLAAERRDVEPVHAAR